MPANVDTSCLMSDESSRDLNGTRDSSAGSLLDYSSTLQGGSANSKEVTFASKQLGSLSSNNSSSTSTHPTSSTNKANTEKLHNVSLNDNSSGDDEEENRDDDVTMTNTPMKSTSFQFGNSLPDLKVEVEFLHHQLTERDQKINDLQQQVQEGKRSTDRLQSRLNIFLGGPNTKDDVSAHGKLMRVYKQLQDVEQERDDYRDKSVELSVSLAEAKARVSTLESSLEEYQALVTSSAEGRAWWRKFRKVQQGEQQEEEVPVGPAKNTPPQVTFLRVSDSSTAEDNNNKEARDATDSSNDNKPWSNRTLKSYFSTPERENGRSHDNSSDGPASGLKQRLGNRLTGLAGGRMPRGNNNNGGASA